MKKDEERCKNHMKCSKKYKYQEMVLCENKKNNKKTLDYLCKMLYSEFTKMFKEEGGGL